MVGVCLYITIIFIFIGEIARVLPVRARGNPSRHRPCAPLCGLLLLWVCCKRTKLKNNCNTIPMVFVTLWYFDIWTYEQLFIWINIHMSQCNKITMWRCNTIPIKTRHIVTLCVTLCALCDKKIKNAFIFVFSAFLSFNDKIIM